MEQHQTPNIKKKLTEQEAAAQFVLYIIKEAKSAWPIIHKNLKDYFKEKFIVENEKMAAFDLSLAAIAQDLQVVKNLFPKDQAERIEKWVLKCIDTEDWGEYALDEVKRYSDKFENNIQNISAGGDPLSAIPARLLQRWLGKNIQNFDVEMSGKKTGIINPVLLMMVSSMLVALLGTWKRLKDNFKIVEGDIPFDENISGLKDYKPVLDEEKPDGTVQYRDVRGKLREKQLSPEQFEEFKKKLNKVGVKRIYKVLIKGPWDGVKEADSTLFADDMSGSVDKDGNLYATCHYENGEPKYHTVAKRLWERMDEVEAIMLNPNLSEKQRVEEIRKLTKD